MRAMGYMMNNKEQIKDWPFEHAEKIVESLGGSLINIDKHGFSREFQFKKFGVEYRVIWYRNQSTLICGDLRVMFNKAEISNTWPSPENCEMKVQFRDGKGDVVAVIPIAYHDGGNDE